MLDDRQENWFCVCFGVNQGRSGLKVKHERGVSPFEGCVDVKSIAEARRTRSNRRGCPSLFADTIPLRVLCALRDSAISVR